MSDFKHFKLAVQARGGVWESDDVYFSQHKDGYSAAYLPSYPNYSHKDEHIYSAGLIADISGSLHLSNKQ